ncbi:MAG TPA: helix-turn-helix domain-containing protein [Gemmataceae bacterium]|nr:helix-turn-helix domain-containing protein [Gemmataceae bacterium]
MARMPIQLSETEQATVAAERYAHPDRHVRRKLLVLWSVHTGLTHVQAGKVAGVGRATVQRYLAAYRKGGLDGLRHWGVVGPVSALAGHADTIKASLNEKPVRTIAEAAERIEQLTGLNRRLTQTRVFLKGLGFQWQRTRAVPVPPKSL